MPPFEILLIMRNMTTRNQRTHLAITLCVMFLGMAAEYMAQMANVSTLEAFRASLWILGLGG